jgi:hypothetical protein
MTPEQIERLNSEMADGIILEIHKLLRPLPCLCGAGPQEVPGIFLRERILCIMNLLRQRIVQLGGEDPFKSELGDGER